ncbi:MAG TPA: hypothetical protein VKS60_14860 [Stellaceae bacterium]|nr:hypothetical protein [Stellaceae bacterium]
MGLLERRAAKAFQDDVYPALQQRIEAAAGHPVAVEIDWESLQTPDSAPLFAEAWSKVFFEPLIAALEGVAIDDLGRQALADGLKSIRILDSGTMRVALDAGELIVDYPATANLADGEERRQEIQKTLERGL